MKQQGDFKEKADDSVNLYQAARALMTAWSSSWQVFKTMVEQRANFNDPRLKYKALVFNLHALSGAIKSCKKPPAGVNIIDFQFCAVQFVARYSTSLLSLLPLFVAFHYVEMLGNHSCIVARRLTRVRAYGLLEACGSGSIR